MISNPVGNSRWLARALGLFGLALGATALALLVDGKDIAGNAYGGASRLLTISTDIAYFGIIFLGCVVALRRPGNPIGWLLAIGGSTFELINLMRVYAGYARAHSLAGANLSLALEDYLWIPAVGMTLIFVGLLFPSGRLLSPRWRWVAAFAAGGVALAYITNTVTVGPADYHSPGAVNELRLSGTAFAVADFLSASIVLVPVAVLATVLSLVLRYRRGGAEERQQIRVVMFATALYGITYPINLGFNLATGHGVVWLEELTVLGIVGVPAGTAVAVLKYRLYDIDVVISRTLLFGSMAAFITAVYIAIVVGVGALVGSGNRPNLVLSIVATAVVAVAFQPVREFLQKLANRLVYGKRATPYEVLSQFSDRAAHTYDMDDALPRMARVLAEGTGAERAEVWLRSGEVLSHAASWPEANGSSTSRPPILLGGELMAAGPGPHSVAVRYRGEVLGALTVSKRPGETLSPIEYKLIDDLAHQAGLVLKNVGLTSELATQLKDLRESRQRLVAAQDGERRRLERNLHDGAQQNLVALKVKLGLVELLAERDPARAREILGQLKGDADEALDTLRDLARGIYPPLLADKGLEVALRAQATKAMLPVEVDADGIGRYVQDIEAAVYFCCLEGLQNIQKYARASRAKIRLSEDSVDGINSLHFTIEDDGAGFDPATTALGAGLQNIKDRMDALGGAVAVTSSPGSGTRLSGNLPASRQS